MNYLKKNISKQQFCHQLCSGKTQREAAARNSTQVGIHPSGDVTWLWQAGGAGRKDGGSWCAHSRRGEGKMRILPRKELKLILSGGTFALHLHVRFGCPWHRAAAANSEPNAGPGTTTAAAALIIFSSTSAHLRISKRRLLVRSWLRIGVVCLSEIRLSSPPRAFSPREAVVPAPLPWPPVFGKFS